MESNVLPEPSAVPDAASREDFARVALPHLDAVHRVARALTGDADEAADLVQETFLRAVRHWHTFAPGADPRRWLATICRNVWRAQRPAAARAVPLDEETVDFLPAAHLHLAAVRLSLDTLYERPDLGPAIRRAIDQLDPPFRDVVLLCDVEDCTYDEAAALLQVPVGTIRSRLYRARHRLQTELLAWAQDAGLASSPAEHA